MDQQYFVYITTNFTHTVLYTGITNDVHRRMKEHSVHDPKTFAGRYFADRLVHIERFDNPDEAISREKQIKAGSRRKKIRLIENLNPEWEPLNQRLGELL